MGTGGSLASKFSGFANTIDLAEELLRVSAAAIVLLFVPPEKSWVKRKAL